MKTLKKIASNMYEISEGRKDTFISYQSEVLTIDRDAQTITLHAAWDYSPTTRKQRNKYLNRAGFTEIAPASELKKAIKAGQFTLSNGLVYAVIMA